MKKLLLASTALVLSAGIAAADVTVGGSGRMGILSPFESQLAPGQESEVGFVSRIRITFAGSGETDGGLTFGGSIRADNAGNGNDGSTEPGQQQTAGSVFISGAFGRLSMGDVSGAAEAAVGDLSGVGLTGLGDNNENIYLSNATSNARSAMRYDYTTGAFGFHISADEPAQNDTEAYSVAVTYSSDTIKAGLGYESQNDVGDHIIAGASATFGAAAVKVTYGMFDADTGGPVADFDQYGLSVDYTIDALKLIGYYRVVDSTGADADFYGIGATYDLGGGASLAGGYAVRDVDGSDSEGSYDFGINFTF
ncbi:MAG: porin [Rhodobacteraceae bacterium]|jgi:outer membrane protein OmpU|nr:porin [Paracoccaceae bacterium]